ncbi:MAG: pyridoxamine 5'-phosphate oxidase family protein [Candidatus Hodarchaeales archaeon]
MARQDLDFLELKESIITFLEGKNSIVLATSSNNRVTARSISFVNKGLEIFFVSWTHHIKSVQIRANENVALCIGGLQVEGKATLRGAPFDPNNKEYIDLYKEKHLQYYSKFAKMPDTTIITIEPTLIIKLVNIKGDFYRDHLDLTNNIAYRLRIED